MPDWPQSWNSWLDDQFAVGSTTPRWAPDISSSGTTNVPVPSLKARACWWAPTKERTAACITTTALHTCSNNKAHRQRFVCTHASMCTFHSSRRSNRHLASRPEKRPRRRRNRHQQRRLMDLVVPTTRPDFLFLNHGKNVWPEKRRSPRESRFAAPSNLRSGMGVDAGNIMCETWRRLAGVFS